MNQTKPTGQERVNYNLTKALLYITKLKHLSTKTQNNSTQKRVTSLNQKILNIKKRLVFLSTRAKDKITKFYASNALKEIAQKLKELKNSY
jgi:hypothetical protein